MSRILTLGALLTAAALASGAWAQPAPAPARVAPAPPAFKIGQMVTDRTGAPVGAIESRGEAAAGAMVVIRIDGKLVGVPQGTLALRPGGGAVSAQTKAQILAAAQAPR